jgi:hypothetical protein
MIAGILMIKKVIEIVLFLRKLYVIFKKTNCFRKKMSEVGVGVSHMKKKRMYYVDKTET